MSLLKIMKVSEAGERCWGVGGAERTVVKGEPLPPTPRKGTTCRLVDRTKH